MIKITNNLINFVLEPKKNIANLGVRIVGYLFLGVAIIMGLYFLFEFLVPILGYIQSGVLFTLVFAIVGLLLIFGSRRKKPRPLEDMIEKTEAIIKNIDVDALVAENTYKIILFSFVSGLVLSGLKDCKKGGLNNLCELLKTMSHWKKF